MLATPMRSELARSAVIPFGPRHPTAFHKSYTIHRKKKSTSCGIPSGASSPRPMRRRPSDQVECTGASSPGPKRRRLSGRVESAGCHFRLRHHRPHPAPTTSASASMASGFDWYAVWHRIWMLRRHWQRFVFLGRIKSMRFYFWTEMGHAGWKNQEGISGHVLTDIRASCWLQAPRSKRQMVKEGGCGVTACLDAAAEAEG